MFLVPRPATPDDAARAPSAHPHAAGVAVVVARSVAAVAVLVCGWQALGSQVYFEATDEALFRADVGRTLRVPPVVGLLVLLAGALLARPGLWGRRPAAILGLVTALVATAVPVEALVVAHRRLHPSFAVERAAVRAFGVQGRGTGRGDVQAVVTAHPGLTVTWTVDGPAGPACRAAVAEFGRWADRGTVYVPPRSRGLVERAGRRGPDTVTLSCIGGPRPGSPVDVSLALTR